MAQVAPRIQPNTKIFLESIFSTSNAGCEHTLDALPSLYQRTLQEMAGKLSQNELALLLDISENIRYVKSGGGSLAGQQIGMVIVNAYQLQPGQYEKDYGVQSDTVTAKIEALTSFQRFCLEIWIDRFKREDIELNDKIGQLA